MKQSIQKGFTLIEIMTAVAITSILAAIAFPSYQIYINNTKVAKCHSEAVTYVREHGTNIITTPSTINAPSTYSPSSCLSATDTDPVIITTLTNDATFIARDTSATIVTCVWLTLSCSTP